MSKGRKPRIWTIVLLGFFLYCTYVVIDQQKIFNSKDMELLDLQEKIRTEEKVAEDLKKDKEIIDSDEYIEKTAREKLGMVKQDEKVFIDVNR